MLAPSSRRQQALPRRHAREAHRLAREVKRVAALAHQLKSRGGQLAIAVDSFEGVERLAQAIGPFGHRVFTDSAPVLEVELASRSGLGWRGKHTLALSREAGLYAAHEMMEALDPNHRSELAQTMLAECENLLDGEPDVVR